MRTRERQGQSPRALVVHSGDLSEAKRLAGRVAEAFPGCAIGLPAAAVATMTIPQLSRRDRVVICHHVGAFGVRALIGYMRLSGVPVPAVVAGYTDAHNHPRAASRNLGVPCLPEGFDASCLREAFRLAYEVRPDEIDIPPVDVDPPVPDDAAFAIVSPIGDILDSSHALSQLTGFSRQELLGKPVSALFFGEHADQVVSRAWSGAEPHDVLTDVQSKGGRHRQLVLRQEPCFVGSLLAGHLCRFSDTLDKDGPCEPVDTCHRPLAAPASPLGDRSHPFAGFDLWRRTSSRTDQLVLPTLSGAPDGNHAAPSGAATEVARAQRRS